MNKKIAVISLAAVANGSLLSPVGKAADFANAQHIYVPPSLIRHDLDALGTNNWNFPGLSSSAGGGALSNYQNIPGLSTQINNIKSKIDALLSSGQFPEAENLTRAGLKYFPTSSILKSKFVSITSAEGQAFLAGQNIDLAGKKAREALACDPSARVAKSVEGKVLRAQGLDPNSASAHVQAADSLIGDGRLLEAGVEYKMSAAIKPNAPAYVGLGNLALGKGQVIDAAHHYQHALSVDPQYAPAYRQRGVLNYVMKDPVGAHNDFSRAVTLAPNDKLAGDALIGLWKQQVAANPNSVNGHLGLARAYLQTNDLESARSEYKTVVALDPNNPALPEARRSFKLALNKQQASQSLQAAKTLDQQGALNEAHDKLTEAATYSPSDPEILLYHGQVCEKLGLYQQAHDNYMSVLKTDPQNIEAASRLKAMTGKTGLHADPSSVNPPAFAPNNSDIFNVPLKSPLAPKTQSLEQMQLKTNGQLANTFNENVNVNACASKGNVCNDLYSDLDDQLAQSLYITDIDEVSMLSNFASSLRALMLTEKQFLQPPKKQYTKGYDASYVSDVGYPQ